MSPTAVRRCNSELVSSPSLFLARLRSVATVVGLRLSSSAISRAVNPRPICPNPPTVLRLVALPSPSRDGSFQRLSPAGSRCLRTRSSWRDCAGRPSPERRGAASVPGSRSRTTSHLVPSVSTIRGLALRIDQPFDRRKLISGCCSTLCRPGGVGGDAIREWPRIFSAGCWKLSFDWRRPTGRSVAARRRAERCGKWCSAAPREGTGGSSSRT